MLPQAGTHQFLRSNIYWLYHLFWGSLRLTLLVLGQHTPQWPDEPLRGIRPTTAYRSG